MTPGADERGSKRDAHRAREVLLVDASPGPEAEAQLAAPRAGVGLDQEAPGAVLHRDGAGGLHPLVAFTHVRAQAVEQLNAGGQAERAAEADPDSEVVRLVDRDLGLGFRRRLLPCSSTR